MEADAGYHRFLARPELQPWLASLWIQDSPPAVAPPTTVRVELIVRYGDPFVHLEDGRATTVPAVAALGQRTRPIMAAAGGTTGLVIAGLRPWASDALLGDLAASLSDRVVDVADLVGRSRTSSPLDQVAAARRPEECSRAVEAFLEELLQRRPPDPLAPPVPSGSTRRGEARPSTISPKSSV
jgi:hypothetical protein